MRSRLSVDSVVLGYPRGPEVVSGASLELEAGSFAALVGPNGSGKSTLLFALAGLLPPRSGRISVDGRGLYAMPRAERARSVSIVLTDAVKPEWMLSREIAALGRHPLSGPFGGLSRRDEEAVDRALEMAGASAFANRSFASLSDGERQKVLLARALAQDCPVLLLDEPTVFLDAPSKRNSLRLLRRLAREEGKIVIAALHEIDLALEFSDRLWLLNARDKRLAEGLPEAMALSGAIASAFGLQPPGDAEASGARGGMDAIFPPGGRGGERGSAMVSGGDPRTRYWTEALLLRKGYALENGKEGREGIRVAISSGDGGSPIWKYSSGAYNAEFGDIESLSRRLDEA